MTDPFVWTQDYVNDNEQPCVNVLMEGLQTLKTQLKKKKFADAAENLEAIVHGLKMLCAIDADCDEYYSASLYSNSYALAKVYLFGLEDEEKGVPALEKACEAAAHCAAFPSRTDMARSDLAVMEDVLADFRSGRPLAKIRKELFRHFPKDILEKL